MTRCPEFYEKFERDGNFCGLSAGAISQIKAYRELIDKISKQGIDRTLVYEHFPEGAAREITRLRDDETRLKGLNYVVSCLKRNEKITASDLRSSIKAWLKSESTTCNVGHVSKKFTNVNSPTEQKPAPECKPLSEVMAPAPDVPCGSSSFHTAAQELAATRGGIAGEMFPDGLNPSNSMELKPAWTPAACPACEHVIIQKVLGNKCKLDGGLCCNVKVCPVERRKQMAAAGGFVPEGQPRPITDEHRPLKIIPVQLTKAEAEAAITSIIRGYFTPKSREQWDSLKKMGKWDTDLEVLEGLRDDAAERIA